jgi:CRP-like cAMP-binding protein
VGSELRQRLEVFTRLSQEDQAALDRLSHGSTCEVAARYDLIREGDAPNYLYLILSGWACRYKTLPDGRRQIVALFLPGDLCDLHVYILREMDHNVGAITRLKVAEVGREEFEQLVSERPRVTQALWWNELVTVAIQREWTLNVGARSAYERIAHLFCEIFMRLRAIRMTRGNECDCPLTQNDIANATGLTPVHVNRTLQELRRDRIIMLGNRVLTIPNLAALRNAALFNDNYLHLKHDGAHLDANE